MANKTIDNLQEFTSPLTNDDLFIMYDVNPPAQGDENYSDTANTKKVTLGQLTQKLSDTFGSPYENIQENLYHSVKLNNMFFNQVGESSFFNVAEGNRTTATGGNSHAEGYSTQATGTSSHAEGELTKATKDHSHAEGYRTNATGYQSHAEGNSTTASGGAAHAEGDNTVASGLYSHAQNVGTIAAGVYQTAIGRYNVKDQSDQYAFIIGNGGSNLSRHNAVTVNWEGAIFAPEINISDTANIDKLNITTSAVVPTVSDLADSSTKIANTAFVQNLLTSKIGTSNNSRYGTTILEMIHSLGYSHDYSNNNTMESLLISQNYDSSSLPMINFGYWSGKHPDDAPTDTATPNDILYWQCLTLSGRIQFAWPTNTSTPKIFVRQVSNSNNIYTVGNWHRIQYIN